MSKSKQGIGQSQKISETQNNQFKKSRFNLDAKEFNSNDQSKQSEQPAIIDKIKSSDYTKQSQNQKLGQPTSNTQLDTSLFKYSDRFQQLKLQDLDSESDVIEYASVDEQKYIGNYDQYKFRSHGKQHQYHQSLQDSNENSNIMSNFTSEKSQGNTFLRDNDSKNSYEKYTAMQDPMYDMYDDYQDYVHKNSVQDEEKQRTRNVLVKNQSNPSIQHKPKDKGSVNPQGNRTIQNGEGPSHQNQSPDQGLPQADGQQDEYAKYAREGSKSQKRAIFYNSQDSYDNYDQVAEELLQEHDMFQFQNNGYEADFQQEQVSKFLDNNYNKHDYHSSSNNNIKMTHNNLSFKTSSFKKHDDDTQQYNNEGCLAVQHANQVDKAKLLDQESSRDDQQLEQDHGESELYYYDDVIDQYDQHNQLQCLKQQYVYEEQVDNEDYNMGEYDAYDQHHDESNTQYLEEGEQIEAASLQALFDILDPLLVLDLYIAQGKDMQYCTSYLSEMTADISKKILHGQTIYEDKKQSSEHIIKSLPQQQKLDLAQFKDRQVHYKHQANAFPSLETSSQIQNRILQKSNQKQMSLNQSQIDKQVYGNNNEPSEIIQPYKNHLTNFKDVVGNSSQKKVLRHQRVSYQGQAYQQDPSTSNQYSQNGMRQGQNVDQNITKEKNLNNNNKINSGAQRTNASPSSIDKTQQAKLRALQIHKQLYSRDIEWKSTGTIVSHQYYQLRNKARELAIQRNKHFEAARKAYLQGNRIQANMNSKNGQQLNIQMKEQHRLAAQSIFKVRNERWISDLKKDFILVDLHGLHLGEVEEIFKIEVFNINQLAAYKHLMSTTKVRYLLICVGTGHHSKGPNEPGRLQTFTKELLVCMDFRITEPQAGILELAIKDIIQLMSSRSINLI